MKHYFFGKYYKFVSPDGWTFALIDSYSDEGKLKQIITHQGGFTVEDFSSVQVENNEITFAVSQEGLNLSGKIQMENFHPLKGKTMGPFALLPMQCSHDVYSMFHSLKGKIVINGEEHCFDGGFGYIEGDKGNSFPQKYFWYNSVGKDYGVTLAIATIPFGLFHFTGLLGFVAIGEKQYKLCTYNFAKILSCKKEKIIVKKGKYQLEICPTLTGGFELKAPDVGKMSRMIKENVSVPSSFVFIKGNEVLLLKEDKQSSMEFMA